MTRGRTRITILSGFLGAGKTTLLNALMAEMREAGEPLAVIVNDFGSVNIDAQLVGASDTVEGEVALQDGCICCSIREDLLGALLEMMGRASPPRHVLIEASGVSDPLAVARTFVHPRLQHLVELCAIVVCIDPCEFVQLTRHHWSLASDQVRAADFIVLTKGDLSREGERVATREILRSIAADARIVESSAHSVPCDLLLDRPRMWPRAELEGPRRPAVHVHEIGEGPVERHGGHGYETWTFRASAALSIHALRGVLRRLPPEVFRVKGFVHAAELPGERMVVQVAGRRVEVANAGAWHSAAITELVFLGPEGALQPEQLRAQLESCRIAEGEDIEQGFLREMVGFFERVLDDMQAR